MAKGLGKIQKWILSEAYKRGQRQLGNFESYTQHYLSRREIYEAYFNLKIRSSSINRNHMPSEVNANSSIILWKSLKGLKKRGLVTLRRINSGLGQSGNNFVILTKKGVEIAEFYS